MGRAEQSKFNTLWTLKPNSFQRKHFVWRSQSILPTKPWLGAQPSHGSLQPWLHQGCRPSWTSLCMWGSAQVASLLGPGSVVFASGNSPDGFGLTLEPSFLFPACGRHHRSQLWRRSTCAECSINTFWDALTAFSSRARRAFPCPEQGREAWSG